MFANMSSGTIHLWTKDMPQLKIEIKIARSWNSVQPIFYWSVQICTLPKEKQFLFDLVVENIPNYSVSKFERFSDYEQQSKLKI